MPYDIGATLKACRNKAKVSVKQISDILTEKGFKASESTIYSWENGNSQPTPGALLIMCRAYGVKDVLSTFGYEGYDSNGSIILNLMEIEHMEKYRALDEHGKDMVDMVLEKESERMAQLRQASAPAPAAEPIRFSKHLMVNAAHDDENSTAEDRRADDEMMMDDSEWE